MARAKARRSGQGTVTKRKDGRWEGAITTGYNENGNPLRARVYGNTQAEAVEALNQMIVNKSLGIPITDSKQTLATFMESWLATVIKPNSTPKTYRYYEQTSRLYILPKLGRKPLKDLSPQLVQALLNDLATPRKVGDKEIPGKSGNTLKNVRATLRSALNTARKWRLIHENPCSLVSPPKFDQKEAVYLSLAETKNLLAKAIEHPLGNLIAVGLMTGMRIGEATGIRWEDVDLEDKIIRVRSQLQFENNAFVLRPPKSKAGRRTLPMTEPVVAVLKDQRARQVLWASAVGDTFNELDLVFTTTEGRPLHQKNVDKALKKLAAGAQIETRVSFHKLRHTHATHLAAQGVPLTSIKDLLGHSQYAVTANTYSHAVPSALRGAADLFSDLISPDPLNES